MTATAACSSGDSSTRTAEPPVLTASGCDELAAEYARALEARSQSVLDRVDRETPEQITDALWAELRGAHVAVSLRLEALASESGEGCPLEQFLARTEGTFSKLFQRVVPGHISSAPAGNTWADDWAILDDSIREALDPRFWQVDPPRTGGAERDGRCAREQPHRTSLDAMRSIDGATLPS